MTKKTLTINAAALNFYNAIDHFGNKSKQAQMAFDTLQKLVEPHLEKAIFLVFSGPKGSCSQNAELFFPWRQEALQETYFDLWRKADCKQTRWNHGGVVKGKCASFLTWSQAVAKFKAKDAFRKFLQLKSKFPVSLNIEIKNDSGECRGILEPFSSDNLPLDNLILNERHDILENAIEKLSDRQRTVIRQIHFEEKKGKDIANELGISPTSVTNHLKKGVKKMGSNVDVQALYFEKF